MENTEKLKFKEVMYHLSFRENCCHQFLYCSESFHECLLISMIVYF